MSVPRPKDPLRRNKGKIRLMLQICAHCGMCAESCFLYVANGRDPRYSPAYKMITAFKILSRTRKPISSSEMDIVQDMLWHRCVLCMRCYCPLGIDIPGMIFLGRSICRKKGVYRDYSQDSPSGTRLTL